eukprot:TRINITY_DN5027_c0_g1_i1.p1 TRINITY_DN5027_c0_g1~~TRINITY_DN5027_c0_g1_i1.p1  ORF type:complete len:473 (-),score=78.23 TRINITY_DN5027_c0_g1_i1:175-1530(-)
MCIRDRIDVQRTLRELRVPVYQDVESKQKYFHFYDILLLMTKKILQDEFPDIDFEPPELNNAMKDLLEIRLKALKSIKNLQVSQYTSEELLAVDLISRRVNVLKKKRAMLPKEELKTAAHPPIKYPNLELALEDIEEDGHEKERDLVKKNGQNSMGQSRINDDLGWPISNQPFSIVSVQTVATPHTRDTITPNDSKDNLKDTGLTPTHPFRFFDQVLKDKKEKDDQMSRGHAIILRQEQERFVQAIPDRKSSITSDAASNIHSQGGSSISNEPSALNNSPWHLGSFNDKPEIQNPPKERKFLSENSTPSFRDPLMQQREARKPVQRFEAERHRNEAERGRSLEKNISTRVKEQEAKAISFSRQMIREHVSRNSSLPSIAAQFLRNGSSIKFTEEKGTSANKGTIVYTQTGSSQKPNPVSESQSSQSNRPIVSLSSLPGAGGYELNGRRLYR